MSPRTVIAICSLVCSLCVTAVASAQQAAPAAPSPPLDTPADAVPAEGDPAEAPTNGTDGQEDPAPQDGDPDDGAGPPTRSEATAEPDESGLPAGSVTTDPEGPPAARAIAPAPPGADAQAGSDVSSAAPQSPAAPASSAKTDGPAARPAQSGLPIDAGAAPDPGPPAFEPNWRGSGLAWSHSVAYGTFDRSLQPSYNPSYAWALDAVLRWNFEPKLNARIIQSANIELTDSDFTAEGQQLLFSDTRLRADYRVGTLSLTEHQNLTLMVRGTFLLPVSKASQAATLTTATLGRATVIWSVDQPLAGVSVIAASNFRKNWNRDTTVVIDEAFPCATAGSSAGSVDCRNGTLANVDWASTILGVVNLQVTPALSAALAYAHTWNRSYNLPPATIELLSGPESLGEAERYRFRNTQVIDLTASYMPGQWWTLSVSLTNQFAERGPDGKLRGPFDPQDLYLGVSLFVTPPPPSSGQKQNLLNPINQ